MKKTLSDPIIMFPLIAGVILSGLIHFLYRITPETSLWYNILVEAHGLIFDIFFFAIILVILSKIIERRREIKRYEEELDDYRKWDGEETPYRVAGIIKRLEEEKGKGKIDYSNLSIGQLPKSQIIEIIKSQTPITSLRGAELTKADLSKSSLLRINLQDSDLTGSIFKNAYLIAGNFQNAKMEEANFEEAILKGAKFHGARMAKIILKKANLQNAKFNIARMWNADLREANLYKADLPEAYLVDANLANANLRNSNLSNANLRRVNLTGANLRKSNLTRTDLREVILDDVMVDSVNCFDKFADFRVEGLDYVRSTYYVESLKREDELGKYHLIKRKDNPSEK